MQVDSVIDITKPHMQVETRVPMHSKDNTCTRSMETTIDCSSEDSCMTSDTCEGVSSSDVNHVPDSVTQCTSRTFCNEDRADREGVSSVTFPAHCLMFEVIEKIRDIMICCILITYMHTLLSTVLMSW
jgi:hypothetical protein